MADVPPPRDANAPLAPAVEIDNVRDPSLPRYGWFAGVLEGRLGDADGLRAATAAINALGVVGCDIEIDGGRFSFLFDEEPVPGVRLSVENQDALVAGLQRLVLASATSAGIESTLRGSLVHSTSVVDTLFSVKGGQIESLSRRRTLEERDRLHAPAAPSNGALDSLKATLTGIDGRRGIALLALLLIGGVLVAWNRGYLELLGGTFLARDVDEMPTGSGPFGPTLELTVEKKFGKYVCTVRRGPGYPATSEAVAELIDAAVTAEDRAAANAVGNGGVIGVVLLDDHRKVLVSEEVRLSAFLGDEDAVFEATLRAKLRGRIIELALDASPVGESR